MAQPFIALLLIALTGATTFAQSSAGVRAAWEIDIHGGVVVPNAPTGGSGMLPPAGPPLNTGLGSSARSISSWLFGDGAAQLNQALASFRIAQRITALDPILQSAFAQPRTGGAFGVRIGRSITRRFAVELSIETRPSAWEIADASPAALEAARASFESAWNALLSLPSLATSRSISASADVDTRSGRDVTTTGGVRIAFGATSRFRPYALAGGGLIAHTGATPSATVTGHYQFVVVVPFPQVPPFNFNQTDTVTIQTSIDRAFVGVLGGGFTRDVSPRWAVRVDAREHIGQHRVSTSVSATPAVSSATPGAGFVAIATTPPLIFSTAAGQSSLSGPAISQFRTFESRGTSARLSLTAGVVLRF